MDKDLVDMPLINEEKESGMEQVHWEVFFVVLPLFSGYAGLFALQRQLKDIYQISPDNEKLSYIFGVGASFLYVGNLVFRLLHNVIFCFLSPRNRVVLSMAAMALSMFTLLLVSFVKGMAEVTIAWVFIAYALGGVGIGTFESNVLSTITPFGHTTKMIAVIGIPVGIVLVTIGGFILLELGVFVGYLYAAIFTMLVIGLGIYFVRIYRNSDLPHAANVNEITFRDFLRQMREIRIWLPSIAWNCLALMFDMFCVSLFSPGIILYLRQEKNLRFRWIDASISRFWFITIYNACFFVGDFSSRRIFFPLKRIFPMLFLLFSALGIFCGLANILEIVPFCGLLVAFANGSIYSQTTKTIDTEVDPKYNLIALSFWLFIGDLGSVCGSNVIQPLSHVLRKLYHVHS